MTRIFLVPLALTALAGCALSGCQTDKSASDQKPLTREQLAGESAPRVSPEVTYRRYCVGCHGDDGRGNGGTTGADLTAADGPLAQKPDTTLIASVRDGKLGKTATMPPHKPVLKDPEIAAVIGYLRQRFGHPAKASP